MTPSDSGNHSIAGVVTDEFLDFSASKGYDLRQQAGLKSGQKWCLCASRWLEAFNARVNDADQKVPRVYLHATDAKALDVVDFKSLKSFAADQEVEYVKEPSTRRSEAISHSQEIGGKNPKA